MTIFVSCNSSERLNWEANEQKERISFLALCIISFKMVHLDRLVTLITLHLWNEVE